MDKELTQEQKHQMGIVATLTPYLMALPQSKINEGSLVIYAKALSSLSIAEIDAAMLKLMKTSKWFPTIAEIFEASENIETFITGKSKPTADMAWAEAIKLAHDKWIYGKWEYSCKEVELAVNYFGKMELCQIETDNINTARAQFMRIYESVLKRQRDIKTNGEVLNQLPQKQVNVLIQSLSDKMDIGLKTLE